MDFEYKGGNCIVISSKQGTVVVDGRLSGLGLKDVSLKNAVDIATQKEFAVSSDITIDMPGEYEINNISVTGVPAKRMIDVDDSRRTTMYRLTFPDMTVAILGHIQGSLSDEQLELLGVVDILVIPVGGGGYTLDAHHAVELVRKIDPKVVIPIHYAEKGISYEVPQNGIEDFIKELGGAHETTPKFRVKNGVLPEAQTIVELTRTS